MNNWPKQDPASMNAFYGCPNINHDAEADPDWVRSNVVYIPPPFRLVLAWNPEKVVTKIAIHRKCADSLTRILERIGREVPCDVAEKCQLHMYGGSFMFRTVRGDASKLSMHSWAAAIDLSTIINDLGTKWGDKPNMMPAAVVSIFEAEGWTWGGRFSRPDCQHFQAATI